MKSKPGGQTPR